MTSRSITIGTAPVAVSCSDGVASVKITHANGVTEIRGSIAEISKLAETILDVIKTAVRS